MKPIFISFLFFGNLINLFCALVCPIYPTRKLLSPRNNPSIKTCHDTCSFQYFDEKQYACIGVYYNHSGNFFIKQLNVMRSDGECLKYKQCLLDSDTWITHSFSCCCSTDNCTLHWQDAPLSSPTAAAAAAYNVVSNEKTNMIIINENGFSWKLFILISSLLVITILVILTISLWKLRRERYASKQTKSLMKSLLLLPSSDQLFSSAQELNLGKNSIIYKTIHDHDDVIVKVYKKTHLFMWKNEVTLLKSIDHESIIKILMDGQYDSYLYLVLPFYSNGTLQSYLSATNRKLSINQCLTFFRSLASALVYLHMGRNSSCITIVHRDVKSSNILVDKNELNLCLSDFGIALALPPTLTEKDFVQIGTLRYMAPELLEGCITHTREALCSVDMYALAIVMWEIITQCDLYPTTVYRPPYEEYRKTNVCDGASFASEIYDIVVVRRLRPTLCRSVNNDQYAMMIYDICSVIDACWTQDSDIRMNAQTLVAKLNQFMLHS